MSLCILFVKTYAAICNADSTFLAAYSMALFSNTFSPCKRVFAMVSSCCLVYGWNTTRLHCTDGCMKTSMSWHGKAPLVQTDKDTVAVSGCTIICNVANALHAYLQRLKSLMSLL